MKYLFPILLLAGCVHHSRVHYSCVESNYERSKNHARALLQPSQPLPTLMVKDIKGGHRSAVVLSKYDLNLLQCSIEKYRARHENAETPQERKRTRKKARRPWPRNERVK